MHKFTVKQSLYVPAALAVWIAALLIIGVLVYLAPLEHTVTPVYREAVGKWLTGKQLYREYSFHYPPQFIFAFMPFQLMPGPWGDILWRVVSGSLLAWGLREMAVLSLPRPHSGFLWATWLTLLPGVGALSNGQANALFAAFTTLAAASLAHSRWWRAALCLIGALIMKGAIGLVMLSLAALVYRPLIWRLIPGLAVCLAFPFLFAHPDYVLAQYQQYMQHLLALSVNERHFANLNGLLWKLGASLSNRAFPLLSMAAGLATMIAWWVGSRKRPEAERALLLLGLTGTYLMLFNPMNEINSFVIVAPSLALYAVQAMQSRDHAKRGFGMALIAVSIGIFPELFRSIDWNFGSWWNPLMMLLFSAILIYYIFAGTSLSPIQKLTDLTTKT